MNVENIKDYAKENRVPIVLDDTLSFLLSIIDDNRYQQILEVGTAIGYSAILMGNLASVQHIDTLEIDVDRAKIAAENIKKAKLQDKIDIHIGDAKIFLDNLNQNYDFIFLDGPKGQYIKYIDILLQNLEIGGIIFADNVYFKGMVNGKTPIAKGVRSLVRHLQEFLEYVKSLKNVKVDIYEIGDGICVIKKIK